MNTQTATSTARIASGDANPALNDAPVVFVVDDDVAIRESLESLLRTVGWRVETFASADNSSLAAAPTGRAASCST